MKLVLVHGRAQEGKDPVPLKKLWVDTLKLGLAKSGLTLPINENDIIFPFYGDKLDELVTRLNQPMENVIARGNAVPNKDAVFFNDFLMEIAANSNISAEEIQTNNPGFITEKGPLNWGWVQAILRTIDKRQKWGEWAIKKFTYDVFLYLTLNGIKDEINKIVKQSIPSEPCVVVAHSLGTIVSYNILRDNADLKVARFITVGSPLGLHSVKKYLKTPILMPESIEYGWFNAFDDRDVVALNPLNKIYFDLVPAIDNKRDVNNQTDNRHGIEGYLNDEKVAKEIYAALVD